MARLAVCLVMLVLVCGSAATVPNCSDVNQCLTPCVSYLTGDGTDPSNTCCTGVVTVKEMAATKADRQAVCLCLKAAAGSIVGLNISRAASLPDKCGVTIDIPISPDVDCTKIE